MKKGEKVLKPSLSFKILFLFVVAAVILGLSTFSCGGSGDKGPSPEEQIIEAKFQTKFQAAQQAFKKGNYQEAFDRLQQAETIKKTPESAKFARTLTVKLEEIKDDDAFKKAVSEGTSAAVAGYVKSFPSGRHAKEAGEKVIQLKIEEDKKEAERQRKLAASIKLRSQYQDLSRDDVKMMLNARGFFEKYYNPNGSFKNQYELKVINKEAELAIVIDYATALLWHQSGSPYYMNFEKSQKWIEDLNKAKFAGYSDWRMPTLEEVASLLEKTESKEDLFIDDIFSREQRYIWTGDTFEKTKYWVVDFFSGDMSRVDVGLNVFVRPVRSMK